MIIENAQVVAVDGLHAVVQTQRRSACGACSVNDGCGVALLTRLFSRKICTLKVLNPVSANVGDKVQIGISENSLIKSALLLYVLPLFLVLIAILLAAIIFGSELTDFTAIMFSLTGFTVGLLFVKLLGKRLGERPEFQTKILSISCDATLPVFSRNN